MGAETRRPNSKVARVIDEYDLEGWGETLEERWIGDGVERTSLRDLADALNAAILDAAMQDVDQSWTSSDVESAYQSLTGDAASRADRVRKKRDLERAGVDVDAIESDFVTHQTVHTYLTSCRGATLPDRSSGVDDEITRIRRLQGRTTAVVESTLERMAGSGALDDHEYEVYPEVQVICGDCGSAFSVDTLLREGGCGCER